MKELKLTLTIHNGSLECHKVVDKIYRIKPLHEDWHELSCNGTTIAKLVSEEECRRVIWQYWTEKGIKLNPIKDEDFEIVNDTSM